MMYAMNMQLDNSRPSHNNILLNYYIVISVLLFCTGSEISSTVVLSK